MKKHVVMGWDAAWTPGGSGAWSVLEKSGNRWEVRLLERSPTSGEGCFPSLEKMIGEWQPGLIALDLPVADVPVSAYREADRATTRAFSRFGCPVHSPTPERPGNWGWEITQVLHKAGYGCKTGHKRQGPGFAEVYPHTGLLKLLRRSGRFPYKVSRASRLWPGVSGTEKKKRLLEADQVILDALKKELTFPVSPVFPKPDAPLYVFKQTEDLLDALVCAWSAVQILEQNFEPFGDEHSAIWNPPLKGLDLESSTL